MNEGAVDEPAQEKQVRKRRGGNVRPEERTNERELLKTGTNSRNEFGAHKEVGEGTFAGTTNLEGANDLTPKRTNERPNTQRNEGTYLQRNRVENREERPRLGHPKRRAYPPPVALMHLALHAPYALAR